MKKVDFISRLNEVRKVNKKTVKGRIKKKYRTVDDELSWRLFQVFPTQWSDEERFRGMSLLITHITAFVLGKLHLNIDTDEIAESLYSELREELGYFMSKKYLKELVNQIMRIKLLNS